MEVIPKSEQVKALRYALDYWTRLERVADYGEVELDNNLVENAIRPLAIGRKKLLFFEEKPAGKHSAIYDTLIQNCRIHQIDPAKYVEDIFKRLPFATNQTFDLFTPVAWTKANPRCANREELTTASATGPITEL